MWENQQGYEEYKGISQVNRTFTREDQEGFRVQNLKFGVDDDDGDDDDHDDADGDDDDDVDDDDVDDDDDDAAFPCSQPSCKNVPFLPGFQLMPG